jgi:small subunit ribosomal protein S2
VLEGKAAVPEVPSGDDEFVELDEEGRPRAAKARAKKAPAKKKARVSKVRSRAGADETGDAAAESLDADAAGARDVAADEPAAPDAGDAQD